MNNPDNKVRTLWLAGVLHAFTHLYQVALLPLYLPMQEQFGLKSVGQSTLLVTIMMLAYFAPSYPMGMLADRVSRKKLLGFGLLLNGLGFVGLALSPNYGSAIACVIVAGIGGSFYHPAATALVAGLYPKSTGRALGLVGVGAGVGFFIGPLYAGWRAAHAGWRAPVLELGLLGVVGALVFWVLAIEKPTDRKLMPVAHANLFSTPALWLFFIAAAFAFSLRDFTGTSMGTLGSLFMQQAHGYSVKTTGTAVSGIFLAAIISNPLFGRLSDRGRYWWTTLVLVLAAAVVIAFPHLPPGLLIPALIVYGFFFMASYPMMEAALMESVPDAVRGRVFGFFITIGGVVGNLSHWLVGEWVKHLGPRSASPAGYYPIYGVMGGLVLISLLGLPCMRALRRREEDAGALPTVPASVSAK